MSNISIDELGDGLIGSRQPSTIRPSTPVNGMIIDEDDLEFLRQFTAGKDREEHASTSGENAEGKGHDSRPRARRYTNPYSQELSPDLAQLLSDLEESDNERERRRQEQIAAEKRRVEAAEAEKDALAISRLTGAGYSFHGDGYQNKPIPINKPYSKDESSFIPLLRDPTSWTLPSFLALTREETYQAVSWASELDMSSIFSEEEMPDFPCLDRWSSEETLDSLLETSFLVLLRDTDPEIFDIAMRRLYYLLARAMPFSIKSLESIQDELAQDIPRGLKGYPICIFASLYPDYGTEMVTVGEEVAASLGSFYRLFRIRDSIECYRDAYGLLDAECTTLSNLYFSALIESKGEGGIRDPRSLEMTALRLGLDGERETLEEIGKRYDLTRERVRQIVQKVNKGFDVSKSRRFVSFRTAILAEALRFGMAGRVDELKQSIVESHLSWATESSIEAALSISPDLIISQETFHIVDTPCKGCERAKAVLKELLKAGGVKAVDELARELNCAGHCHITPSGDALSLSIGWNALLVSSCGYIGSKTSAFMNDLLHPKSRASAIRRAIYKANGAPVTVDDIAREFSGGRISQKDRAAISSYMTRPDSDMVLWGQSTYIQASRMPHPVDLLEDIAAWIKDTFEDNDIPILGIEGIFSEFKDDCNELGIPNHQALYSELRWLDDWDLLLREYPWVCESSSTDEETTFAKFFEAELQQHNGFISDDEARDLAARALAQSFQLSGMLQYKNNLIHADGGIYDLNMMDIDYEEFDEFVWDLSDTMCEGELVSARAVFQENRSRCARMGIRSYEMLYRILDLREGHLPINASRMPHLIKSDRPFISVKEAIRDYIRNAGHFVSTSEIREEFAGRRGVTESNLNPSSYVGGDIIKAREGYYTSEETILDYIGSIDDVELSLARYCDRTKERERLFYDLNQASSKLAEEYGRWLSGYILQWALSKSKRFRIFGPDKCALVDTHRHPSVQSDEAFFHALIEYEFYGFATWHDFSTKLEKLGIAKSISPDFFATMRTIEASDVLIRVVG